MLLFESDSFLALFTLRSVRKRSQLELELDDGNQRYIRIRRGLIVYHRCILDWIRPVKRLAVSRLLYWDILSENKQSADC
jgi:hypothetical protein